MTLPEVFPTNEEISFFHTLSPEGIKLLHTIYSVDTDPSKSRPYPGRPHVNEPMALPAILWTARLNYTNLPVKADYLRLQSRGIIESQKGVIIVPDNRLQALAAAAMQI